MKGVVMVSLVEALEKVEGVPLDEKDVLADLANETDETLADLVEWSGEFDPSRLEDDCGDYVGGEYISDSDAADYLAESDYADMAAEELYGVRCWQDAPYSKLGCVACFAKELKLRHMVNKYEYELEEYSHRYRLANEGIDGIICDDPKIMVTEDDAKKFADDFKNCIDDDDWSGAVSFLEEIDQNAERSEDGKTLTIDYEEVFG